MKELVLGLNLRLCLLWYIKKQIDHNYIKAVHIIEKHAPDSGLESFLSLFCPPVCTY